MAASFGFFLIFNNDGPSYVYLSKEDFVIGTGQGSDFQVNVGGLELPQDVVICRVVRKRSRSRPSVLLPHLVPQGSVPIQIGTHRTEPRKYYALKENDNVRVPIRMAGNMVSQWLILTYRDIKPGSIFAHYHLTRILGSGGFGFVHKGIDVRTGSIHAVKVVRKVRTLQSGTTKDPVQKEVDILKGLNHPYIVPLDSVFQEDQYLFLVMELMVEGSLHDLIVRKGPLTESDCRLVVLDVCSALTYLHARAIVHRDIKPVNILIRSCDPLSVKVSDFGLAKIVEGGTDLRTLCGTPDFMAPEMGPLQSYDHKVDTWALGVTLFAILSGKSPFTNRENGCHIRWKRLPEDTSKHATQLVCRMLTENPMCRPAAVEIPNHPWFLMPAGVQVPVIVHPPQPPQPSQPAAQSSPTFIVGNKVIVALMLFGVLFRCETLGDLLCRLTVLAGVIGLSLFYS